MQVYSCNSLARRIRIDESRASGSTTKLLRYDDRGTASVFAASVGIDDPGLRAYDSPCDGSFSISCP
jgi:hypothetical protein